MSAILVDSQIREGETQATSKEYLFPQNRIEFNDKQDYTEIQVSIPGKDSVPLEYNFGVTDTINDLIDQLKTKDNTSYKATIVKIGGSSVNQYNHIFSIEDTGYIESLGEGLGCKVFIIEKGGLTEYEVTQDIDTIDDDLTGAGGGGGGGSGNLTATPPFATTKGKKSYTSAECGTDFTGKTLYETRLDQTIIKNSKVSINGGGGIDFVDDPQTKTCYVTYTS